MTTRVRYFAAAAEAAGTDAEDRGEHSLEQLRTPSTMTAHRGRMSASAAMTTVRSTTPS